jgi:peptidoglycan/LPS O-acetylase OafA/YrhL
VVCVATIVIFRLPRAPWWPQPPLSLSTIVANLTLTTNLVYKDVVTSPLWSLPIEVQMYVALPFIYLIGRRYGLNGIIVLVVLACVAAEFCRGSPGGWASRRTHRHSWPESSRISWLRSARTAPAVHCLAAHRDRGRKSSRRGGSVF